ncbi:hypothetical protein MZO42_17615 [Sphingomonas psychrotolerans]|uniref:DUF4345 domain-containing protein n=1 Tax=Sphingomonas psychrotolerans TaxID=1327635 RepID=A0ABU3N7P9_9SPHN|nr:hypothetical protein [Sphingomonas psychrotolerans]MDT8760522.1 hypothetical protein [Sphingomonas psychrotolerans]
MLSPLGVLYVYGFWIALPLTCLAAFLWGGRIERVMSLVFLLALVATTAVLRSYADPFSSTRIALATVDCVVLLALLVAATKSSRGWLIWASAFQVIATTAHLSRLMVPDLSRLAYGLMEGASGWPVLLALMTGIWRHHHRSRANDASAS